MARQTIPDGELLDIALDLFRTYGFEGVSLSRLAEATGLEKASLYYRYPDGKEGILLAVLTHAVQWFEENVFQPLKTSAAPRKRIQLVAENLRAFYRDGTRSCVLDVLSIAGASDTVASALAQTVRVWIDAFAALAHESGMAPRTARLRAEEALERIEGSLILARTLQDPAPFLRAIKLLPDLLTKL